MSGQQWGAWPYLDDWYRLDIMDEGGGYNYKFDNVLNDDVYNVDFKSKK